MGCPDFFALNHENLEDEDFSAMQALESYIDPVVWTKWEVRR